MFRDAVMAIVLVVGIILMASLALAASQKTDSFYIYPNQPKGTALYQMFRLDISDGITASDPNDERVAGETSITNGDWSQCVDARSYRKAKAIVHEYGTGSVVYKIWNLISPVGADDVETNTNGTISGVDVAGVEDPSTAPTPSDPDPFATDLTAVSGVTLEGNDLTEFSIANQPLGIICFEVDLCVTNCDSSAMLHLVK
jgi:hypothetical protein